MAAPVGHIFLSLLLLNNYLPEKDKKNFIIGTSFPDSRYVSKIKREKTHKKNIRLQDIFEEESSFMSGLLFHSFVDEIREQYMQKSKIYEIAPKSKYTSFVLKFFEDQLLYQRVKNWPKISSYFDSILEEEKAFGIEEKKIERWHHFLRVYLKNQKNIKNLINMYFICSYLYLPPIFCKAIASVMYQLKFFPAPVKEMMEVTEKIEGDKKIKKIILDFYDNFERNYLKNK